MDATPSCSPAACATAGSSSSRQRPPRSRGDVAVQKPCEPPLLAVPVFPRLGDAGMMLAKIREHLQPAWKGACEILACRLSRISHRETERSILQYTLRISKSGCQKRIVDR
jgi:hypothetical protein